MVSHNGTYHFMEDTGIKTAQGQKVEPQAKQTGRRKRYGHH